MCDVHCKHAAVRSSLLCPIALQHRTLAVQCRHSAVHWPYSLTLNAQQRASAALQIQQHLLAKGVVRLDLHLRGR